MRTSVWQSLWRRFLLKASENLHIESSCIGLQLPPAHARNTCIFTCATATTVSNIVWATKISSVSRATQDRRKNTANEANVNDWKVAAVEEAGSTGLSTTRETVSCSTCTAVKYVVSIEVLLERLLQSYYRQALNHKAKQYWHKM